MGNEFVKYIIRYQPFEMFHAPYLRIYNLGALLFLIYTNDLPNRLEITEPVMCADDTSLKCSSKCANGQNAINDKNARKKR